MLDDHVLSELITESRDIHSDAIKAARSTRGSWPKSATSAAPIR